MSHTAREEYEDDLGRQEELADMRAEAMVDDAILERCEQEAEQSVDIKDVFGFIFSPYLNQ